jgi:DNA invertase Pin-like site-specific DNA recombinase
MAKKTLITMIRELIEKGATNVEDVHKAIAEMPLKRLAKIEGLRGPIKKLNRMQDRSIGAIYDLIRDINDLIAKYARELIAEARASGIIPAEAPKKKRGAPRKKPAKAAAAKKRATAPAAKKRVVRRKSAPGEAPA